MNSLFQYYQYLDLAIMIALFGAIVGFSNFFSKNNLTTPKYRKNMLALGLVSLAVTIYLMSQNLSYTLYIFGLENFQKRILLPTTHLILDPVILFLIIISLAIMFLSLNVVRKSLYGYENNKLLMLLAGLFAGAGAIQLINNWAYIKLHFIPTSIWILNAYSNSWSVNNFNRMTPPNLALASIILPLVLPMLYFFAARIRQLRKLKTFSVK